MIGIPDEGVNIEIGGSDDLRAIPVHSYLSSGMFTLYDLRVKILFSTDIAAAILPDEDRETFVKDFDKHIKFMKGFPGRWMPSNNSKKAWIERLRDLDIEMLCPQHGSIFLGNDVERFLSWLEALGVSVAV